MKYTKADLLAAIKKINSIEIIEEGDSGNGTMFLRIHKRLFILGFGDDYDLEDVGDSHNIDSLVKADFALSGVYKSKEVENGALGLLDIFRIVNHVNMKSSFPAVINYREGTSLFEIEVRHLSFVNSKNHSITGSAENQFYLNGAILLMSMANMMAMQQLQSEIDLYLTNPDEYIKKCTGKSK